MLSACTAQQPASVPIPTINSPLESHNSAPDPLLGNWLLVDVTVGEQPIDVKIMPVQMRVSKSDEVASAFDLMTSAFCGDGGVQGSSDTLHLLPQGKLEMVHGEVTANSCGPEKDQMTRALSLYRRSVTSYSLIDNTLLFKGIDEASGKEFTIRWERE